MGDDILFSKKVPEVSDCIPWVADQLCLGLCAVELFAIDIGEERWYLAVSFLVGNNNGIAGDRGCDRTV